MTLQKDIFLRVLHRTWWQKTCQQGAKLHHCHPIYIALTEDINIETVKRHSMTIAIASIPHTAVTFIELWQLIATLNKLSMQKSH